jgi:hypothetical protein
MNTWLQENLTKLEEILDEFLDHKPLKDTPGPITIQQTTVTQVDSDMQQEETDSLMAKSEIDGTGRSNW